MYAHYQDFSLSLFFHILTCCCTKSILPWSSFWLYCLSRW